ncbi:MAG: LLM class flavin-dependent oxidoreductase [Acidobacteria bacterium]|nr:LLM class flavin-dependent oxidoreductase [Acidobacteriota bacterium]MCK6684183.1 LLM class flavin-dependent oxidoreductase [Thermoanaerobaculia bacterium]
MGNTKLGVFDFWDDFHATIEVAERVEALGFARYWLAEHLAGSDCSAQLPLALLAGLTSSIRIGTAGVQIRFQNPITAARGFRFLESLFPGRIDAGFCAGGGSAETSVSRYEAPVASGVDAFTTRAAALLAEMRERGPVPSSWAMGNGLRTAAFAAREGIAFAYSVAHQYTPDPGDGDPSIIAAYKAQFVPRPELPAPLSCLTVAVSCAETEDEARRFMQLPYPAATFHVSAIGTGEMCREKIERLTRLHGADEVVVIARSPDLSTTITSYELLARAFELPPRPAAAT